MLYVFLTIAAVLASLWAYSHFKVHAKLDAILGKATGASGTTVVNIHPAPATAPDPVAAVPPRPVVLPPPNVDPPPVVVEPPSPSPVPVPPPGVQPPPPQGPIHESVTIGHEVFPGVIVADVVNGLVSIDPVVLGNPDAAGQTFCALPALASFAPTSRPAETIKFNTYYAKMADAAQWLAVRVVRMQACDMSVSNTGFTPVTLPDGSNDWIAHAWNVGAEYDTWPAVLAHLRTNWHLPTRNGVVLPSH